MRLAKCVAIAHTRQRIPHVGIKGRTAASVSRMSGLRAGRPTTASDSAPRATSRIVSMGRSIFAAASERLKG
jgi:hypothetical protein